MRDRPTGRTADSGFANRGSNPRLSVFRNVAQRLELWSYKPAVVGSSPTVPTVGNACALAGTMRGHSFCPQVRWRSQRLGVVAKLERRWSCKPVIVGSSPTDSIYFSGCGAVVAHLPWEQADAGSNPVAQTFVRVAQRNLQSAGLRNQRSKVRILPRTL